MQDLLQHLRNFNDYFAATEETSPWEFVAGIQKYISSVLVRLDSDYRIQGNVAIHQSAEVEEHVVFKGPLIISPHCFIGAHAYLRGGVFLGPKVSIGPGCEIKSSAILNESRLAHFNFVGDSLIGTDVNMEAGSVIANFHNDRSDKTIYIRHGKTLYATSVQKFGAVIGDYSRIGANAVCSPGTILPAYSIVKRLELVEQDQRQQI